jgi:cell fate regulator YaaT (PSP1 superfamily)
MRVVTGVRFKRPGKIYYFDPANLQIEKGMNVIVDTSMGEEYGEVVISRKEVDDSEVTEPLKKVIRIATEKDERIRLQYKAKEKDAFKTCLEKIEKHGLPMKLIDVEYKYDGSKVIFYFTADKRIDFRELVKDLASVFRTRIELRQIGVRDEVKRCGGNGVCGRQLCCCSFLGNFETVSIKMAKEQNISLNPSKISGNCGRLMCCLRYEQNVYEEKLARLPKVGATVKAPDEGIGIVDSIETLKERIRVKFTDKEGLSYFKRYDAKDVKVIKDVDSKNEDTEIEDEELKKLEEE